MRCQRGGEVFLRTGRPTDQGKTTGCTSRIGALSCFTAISGNPGRGGDKLCGVPKQGPQFVSLAWTLRSPQTQLPIGKDHPQPPRRAEKFFFFDVRWIFFPLFSDHVLRVVWATCYLRFQTREKSAVLSGSNTRI